MNKELPERKRIRLRGFDYGSSGAYFITICTRERRQILSRVAGVPNCPKDELEKDVSVVGTGVPDCPKIELTKHGKIAEKYIKQIGAFYENLSVEDYVIMPNHIHLLLHINEAVTTNICGQSRTPVNYGQSRTPVPTRQTAANSTVSRFVSTFKRFCNKEYGENVWQGRFYDHIIRNHEDYIRHLHYINENPLRWLDDELYTEE